MDGGCDSKLNPFIFILAYFQRSNYELRLVSVTLKWQNNTENTQGGKDPCAPPPGLSKNNLTMLEILCSCDTYVIYKVMSMVLP